MTDLRFPLIPPVDPARAFPIGMPLVTVPTLKWLSSIRDIPFVVFFSVFARPYLLSVEVLVADLDENFALAIKEV